MSRRDARRSYACRSSGSGFLGALDVCPSLGIGRARSIEAMDFN
jgi:hypothetical protein